MLRVRRMVDLRWWLATLLMEPTTGVITIVTIRFIATVASVDLTSYTTTFATSIKKSSWRVQRMFFFFFRLSMFSSDNLSITLTGLLLYSLSCIWCGLGSGIFIGGPWNIKQPWFSTHICCSCALYTNDSLCVCASSFKCDTFFFIDIFHVSCSGISSLVYVES